MLSFFSLQTTHTISLTNVITNVFLFMRIMTVECLNVRSVFINLIRLVKIEVLSNLIFYLKVAMSP